jgi:predicted nucleic acid-binding protein
MKDRLFLDTNVVLDLLGEREHFYDSAARIATLAEKGKIHLVVSALSYSTVYYILSKFEDTNKVKDKIRKFKIFAETSDVTDIIVEKGLSSKFADFDDSLQYYCAIEKECNTIISRNAKDFKESSIPVLSPKEYLSSLITKRS